MERAGSDSNLKKNVVIPKLWASIGSNETILSSPVATQRGFLAITANGTLMHCSTAREGSLLWKSRLAVQITQSPLFNNDIAFVVSDDGFLFALRMSDGSDAWGHQPANVKNLVSIGKKHIYVKDSRNTLVAIDIASGIESGRTNSTVPNIIPNAISDRLFFATALGQVSCFREMDTISPIFTTELSDTTAKAPPAVEKPSESKPQTPETDANPFGDGSDASVSNPFSGIPE